MKFWTPEEDKKLIELVSAGNDFNVVAKEIGKTYKAVQHRKKLLMNGYVKQSEKEKEEESLFEETTKAFANIVKEEYRCKRYKIFNKSFYSGKSEEILNLVISDLHAGKINEFYSPTDGKKIITYNDEVRKQFEQSLLDSLIKLLYLWRYGYKFVKLNVFLLGDLIDNDRIFEGQKDLITKCAGEQLWEAVSEISDMITVLGEYFPKIEVHCVVGNHGRSTNNGKAEEPVQNNFEYHLYRALEIVLSKYEKLNIKFNISESKFGSTKNYQHNIFYSHGDTIRGSNTTYVEKKSKELLLNLEEGYNLHIIGHRHKSDRISLSPSSEMLINGCFIPNDDYAFRLYGVTTKPSQWLFGSSQKRVVSSICIPLDFK